MMGSFFSFVDRTLERRLGMSESGRQWAILTGSSLFSYAVAFLLSPLWSRVYPVEYFAVAALVQTTAGLFTGWATLAYHNAVHTPGEEREAFALVLLALLALATISVVLGGVCFFAAPWVAGQLGGSEELEALVWVAPVIMLSGGTSMTLDQWLVRNRRFIDMAKINCVQVVLAAGIPACGLLQPGFTNFILFGSVGSGVLGVGLRLHYSGFFAAQRRLRCSLADIRQAAVRRANFPRDILPGNLLSEFSAQLPQIVIARHFAVETVGHYARAGSLLLLPITTLGTSLGAIFVQQAGAAYRETGDCRGIFRRKFGWLLLAMTPVYLTLALSAPWLYPWFYGPSWKDTGLLAQPLCLHFFAASIGSILSGVLKFGYNTKWDLAWQVTRVLAVAGGLWVGSRSGDIIHLLWWYAGASACMYALYLALCYWRARQPRPVAAALVPEVPAACSDV
jgi:O-antigen/teichoic acid export membrane protein